MLKKRNYLTIFLCFCLVFFSNAQTNALEKETITVGNEDYEYSISVPNHWSYDAENAIDIMCDIAIFPDTFTLESAVESGEPIIQIAAFEKEDEDVLEDLNFDLAHYKKEYAAAKFLPFEVKHDKYKVYSQLVSIEGVFYQYLTYINPGKKYDNGIAVTMHTGEKAATEQQLKAFQAIVSSLKSLP